MQRLIIANLKLAKRALISENDSLRKYQLAYLETQRERRKTGCCLEKVWVKLVRNFLERAAKQFIHLRSQQRSKQSKKYCNNKI